MENKINVVIGDMLRDALNYDAVAHGANCFNCMGGGIAYGIKKVFPEAYAADCETDCGNIGKLGNYTFAVHNWDIGHDTVIFNLYTQFSHDASIKPLDYEALTLALRKFAFIARERNWKIALPLIGYGLAGGDLDRIIKIMYFEILGVDCDIIIYEGDFDANETKSRVETIIRTIESNEKLTAYVKRQFALLRF